MVDGERGPKVALRTTLSLTPQRLGIEGSSDAVLEAETLNLLESEINRGMRARLATSGLLGQSLHVELAMLDRPPDCGVCRQSSPTRSEESV